VRGVFPRRGEIWHVMTPGRPEDPHQPRRALVVSPNARNYAAGHVIVIPIYTAGGNSPTHVLLPEAVGGLRWNSYAFCEEVTTLDWGFLVDGPLGPPIPRQYLGAAIVGVRRALGEPVPD